MTYDAPATGYGSLLLPPPAERLAVHSADGTELNVERWGPASGPTVVLAHGWTCSIVFWVRQINALADAGYRVVAYDQRGHGDSGVPGPAGYTPEALADDFSAVLSAVTSSADEQVLAVGHSMGSMTLIAFGGRHPEQLRRQVAAAALTSTGMHELFLRSRIVPMPLPLAKLAMPVSVALMGFSPPKGRMPRLNQEIVKYGSLSRGASRSDVDFCARVVEACPPQTRARFARMLSGLDLDGKVRDFAVPTVVVAGGKDRLTPIWHARRMAATLPNLEQLLELPRSGHMTPVQSAAEVNAVLFRLAGRHLEQPGVIVDLAAQEASAERTQEIA
jgi:pimeloyl-ACP methyl ester carboxylesterase